MTLNTRQRNDRDHAAGRHVATPKPDDCFACAVVAAKAQFAPTHLSVIFRKATGEKFLRVLAAPATDTDYVNLAVALDAVSWTTLGEFQLRPGHVVTECDYSRDGVKVRAVSRTI